MLKHAKIILEIQVFPSHQKETIACASVLHTKWHGEVNRHQVRFSLQASPGAGQQHQQASQSSTHEWCRRRLHDRMPVILTTDAAVKKWLQNEDDLGQK